MFTIAGDDGKGINEQTSGRYSCQLVDENGLGFGGVVSLSLTLFDKNTLTIINNRSAQDVLNTNNVVFDTATGILTWDLQPADNAIVDDTRRVEEHRARFTAKWSGSSKQVNDEIVLKVINLRRLP